MPELRHYIVRQIREVEVTANRLEDAMLIAESAFTYGQNSDNGISREVSGTVMGVYGNTDTKVREISLYANEKGKLNV